MKSRGKMELEADERAGPGEYAYLRDLDGTGSMHVCSCGDKGSIEYVMTGSSTSEHSRNPRFPPGWWIWVIGPLLIVGLVALAVWLF